AQYRMSREAGVIRRIGAIFIFSLIGVLLFGRAPHLTRMDFGVAAALAQTWVEGDSADQVPSEVTSEPERLGGGSRRYRNLPGIGPGRCTTMMRAMENWM